ncbi:hypothetical protein OEZ86_001924 [Tetradesmus obliquus]|nr:hypothetical protein OEZ86_001924 [Tetradesmus obliquus]
MRAKASGQREDLDQATLQLHNLVYEQQYYDKEISSKRTFQPSVPDDKLCCISSQDFLQVQQQQQPQQQQQGPHELELARLNYELGQRKQLKAHLQKLLQQKQRAQAELNAAKERIDDLRGNMEAIKSSSRSLLETSLPEAAAVARNREAAELLPLPLYIIYAQAATAASVLGLPLRADITGSTAAAERLAAAEADAAAAKAAPGAAAAEAVQAAKRRRKSEAQEDEAYKVHPLSVTLEVSLGGPEQQQAAAGSVALCFQYYSQLKLVGVAAGAPDDEELLTDLFLGDAGDGLLLEAVAAACSGGALQFGLPGRPRPFRWAQDLAGVDVVASLPASYTGSASDREQLLSSLGAYRSQLRLEAFVERLASAKQARLALKRILEQLAQKKLPPSCWDSKVLTKVSSFIHKWQHMGDAGSAVGGAASLMGSLGRQGGATGSAGQQQQQGWQSLQQGSVQEEGEVAGGGGEGMDATSRLAAAETEEDLLQGLLADEGAASLTGVQASTARAIAAAANQPRGVGGDGGDDALMLDEGELLLLEDYDEAYEQGAGGYKEPSEAGEASAASEEAGEGGAEVASAQGGTQQALLARHSLYRLVLRSSALEAHFHVKVFLAYPLCPPVFVVTRLLDIRDARSGSKGSAALTAVNEVLRLEQQANSLAVQAAAHQLADVLAVQVMQLCQCLDSLSSQLRAKDNVDRLKAKQQLRGRQRQARLTLGCSN